MGKHDNSSFDCNARKNANCRASIMCIQPRNAGRWLGRLLVVSLFCLATVKGTSAYSKSSSAEPPLPALKDGVVVRVKHRLKNDSKLVIRVRTNLPRGTKLMVTVSDEFGWKAQAKAVVRKSGVRAGPFSFSGGVFPPSKYTVKVNTLTLFLQPELVQRALEKGSLLRGPLVTEGSLGKTVESTYAFQLGTSQETQHLVQSQVDKLQEIYSDLGALVQTGRRMDKLRSEATAMQCIDLMKESRERLDASKKRLEGANGTSAFHFRVATTHLGMCVACRGTDPIGQCDAAAEYLALGKKELDSIASSR